MRNYIKYIIPILGVSVLLITGCTKKDDPSSSKTNIQYIADKEKELNDREAQLKLREDAVAEREKQLNGQINNNQTPADTTKTAENKETKDTSKMTKKEKEKEKQQEKVEKKQEIQKEISKRFENPEGTVKDYYEYIQRAISEKGDFDVNIKKAQKYFPTRTADKLKTGYRNTKSFTVVDEPKVVNRKDQTAEVVAKVQQTTVVKKDGKDTDVTKTMTVTYDLAANKDGEWVIKSNSVKEE